MRFFLIIYVADIIIPILLLVKLRLVVKHIASWNYSKWQNSGLF